MSSSNNQGSGQWNIQDYSAPHNIYPSTSSSYPQHATPSFDGPSAPTNLMYPGYHSPQSPQYATLRQAGYPEVGQSTSPTGAPTSSYMSPSSNRHHTSHSHSRRYPDHYGSSSHSVSQSYTSPYPQSQSPTFPHSRSRSYSQANPYPPPQTHIIGGHSSSQISQYPREIPLDSPTHPSPFHAAERPFACDLCSLSFLRQHDLKRHKETHSGEKPYPCNGGCGKTFTRKDALKRHQIVKGCGTLDD